MTAREPSAVEVTWAVHFIAAFTLVCIASVAIVLAVSAIAYYRLPPTNGSAETRPMEAQTTTKEPR